MKKKKYLRPYIMCTKVEVEFSLLANSPNDDDPSAGHGGFGDGGDGDGDGSKDGDCGCNAKSTKDYGFTPIGDLFSGKK